MPDKRTPLKGRLRSRRPLLLVPARHARRHITHSRVTLSGSATSDCEKGDE